MVYRRFHRRVLNDGEFLTLSPDARLVVFVVKLLLDRTGIGVIEHAAFRRATGLSPIRAKRALDELAAGEHWWLRRETRNGLTLWWLRNGLAYEGNVKPTRVLALLREQPRGYDLTAEYCKHYAHLGAHPCLDCGRIVSGNGGCGGVSCARPHARGGATHAGASRAGATRAAERVRGKERKRGAQARAREAGPDGPHAPQESVAELVAKAGVQVPASRLAPEGPPSLSREEQLEQVKRLRGDA